MALTRCPWERQFLALLLALVLVQGGLYALIIPPLQSPDEPQHLANVIVTANAGRPVTEAERSPELEASLAAWMERVDYWYYRWEPVPDPLPPRLDAGIRPPLYYVLVSALAAPFEPGTPLAWLLWGRAVSIALATATAGLIFLALREIFPGDRFIPIVAGAFVGLLPLQAYLGASVTSDTLANFLAASLFYLMARSLTHGVSWARTGGIAAIFVGIVGAFWMGSFLMKLTTLFLIAPASLLGPLVVWARRSEYPPRRLGLGLAVAGGLGLVIGLIVGLRFGPTFDWYLRNRVLYQGSVDSLASRDLLSPTLFAQLANHAGTVYRQFWGSFGWLTIELEPGWYEAWGVALLLAVFGLVLAVGRWLWERLRGDHKYAIEPCPEIARARQAFLVGMGVWLIASLIPLIGLFATSAYPAGALQGRYLLPDLAPLALLLALGWRALLPADWHRAGALGLVAWFTIFNLAALTTAIIPAFYLSPIR